jgi:enoyl-[acyl-carrier protein] reductase II
VAKEIYDTLYSARFDGLPSRVMKTGAAERAGKSGLNLLAAIANSRAIARSLRLPYGQLLLGVLGSGWKQAISLARMANGFKGMRLAAQEGDVEKGILPVGQDTGLIKDIPSVSEMIERMVTEAKVTLAKMNDVMMA